jgi:hypothetical protein
MNDDVVFGIGCFFFGVPKKAPFLFDPKEYVEDIRKALESIANISDIVIECDEVKYQSPPQRIENNIPPIDGRRGIFCPTLIEQIQFELYVPNRVQAEILGKIGMAAPLPTEKFRVYYFDAFHLPVTFIESVDCLDEDRASIGVVVVREFLTQAFANERGRPVRFEILGPSPLHADCCLRIGTGDEFDHEDYLCNREASSGYDKLTFEYNPDLANGEPVESTKQRLFYLLREELGLYYAIQQSRALSIQNFDAIMTQSADLVSLHRENGIVGYVKRLFVASRQINEAFISLAEFEGQAIFETTEFKDACMVQYDTEESCFLQTYVDRALEERPQYPTAQVSRLFDLFEQRRLHNFEYLAVLIAAMLGGIIGALLTAWLTKH